jgi:hypothetical protein
MKLADFVSKRKLSSNAKQAVGYLCGEAFVWVGLLLTLFGGTYSIYTGVAAFLCWVLFLVLIVRRELKLDIKALNDNARANPLISKRRDRGSYDYWDQIGRE